jgi:hypothetical protein
MAQNKISALPESVLFSLGSGHVEDYFIFRFYLWIYNFSAAMEFKSQQQKQMSLRIELTC